MGRTLLALALLLTACGSDVETQPNVSDTSGEVDAADAGSGMDASSDAAVLDASLTTCPPDQVPTTAGACVAVGVEDCGQAFVDPETGLCDPNPERCPPGHLLVFSGEEPGCRAIGIPDCHPDFIHPESGLCEPSVEACGEGFIPVPTQGCVSLDPPGGCGEGTWGHIEELLGDVYVDVGYEGEESDGSREKPWTLIAAALETITTGGRIVLAAGEYEGGLKFESDYDDQGNPLIASVSLVGRCNSMVTITGTVDYAYFEPVAYFTSKMDISVRDVRFAGSHNGLVVIVASVSLSRVSIVGHRDFAILHRGSFASLTATDVLVAHTSSGPGDAPGRGIEMAYGSTLSLDRVAFVGNDEALWATGSDTVISANDTFVTHASGEPEATPGRGFVVSNEASLTITKSAFVGNRHAALVVEDLGTQVDATDLVVSRTGLDPEHSWGVGIVALHGASLNLEGVALWENHQVGLWAQHFGTTVVATELLVAHTQPGPDGSLGRGVHLQDGASLSLERANLVDNQESGLSASGLFTSATAREVLVARTQPRADGHFGCGVAVSESATLTLERSAVVDNHLAAVLFVDAYGSVDRTLLAGTASGGATSAGDGLLAVGSLLTISRVATRGHERAGLLFDRSDGEISLSRASDNGLGLVTQGLPGPILRDDNLITDNVLDTLVDGDLVVTGELAPLPDLPGLE
jgi:hypothetical protein